MNKEAPPASGTGVKKKQRAQHCFVPGCKSGYRSSEQKRSLFSVPKDPAVFAQWQRNIPRADVSLSFTCAVCELHFEESCVERFYADSHVINGEVVRLKRDRPVLKPDAIPTIFPNLPKYFTKKLPRKRKTRENPSTNPSTKKQHTDGDAGVDECTHPLRSEKLDDFDYTSGVKLPSQKWTKLCFSDSVVFACVKLNDVASELSTEKLLLVSITTEAEATCTLHLRGRQFLKTTLSGPSELQSVLNNADRLLLCKGAGTIGDFYPLQLANAPTLLLREKDVISRQCTHLREHKILALPGPTTLRKYLSHYKSGFGFNPTTFAALKEKTADMTELELHGGLVLDEMKLSENISLRASGHAEGFVDLGPYTTNDQKGVPADHGMVLLFQPFRGKWTQILGE
ncbi:hypothetical protein HPB47_006467 [Ixodes persulcatus]|uniref:Uncharacterized protein n=2 Tax=Ixodes persulcatus TaxID=34615 RepID=A0AC60PB47_IXOPE|nr:hypothetical protein HPB47_006475 [Ixodes persulcatus]KAG0416370.1 hypothetical protein HPB47_006467 [Ixodes persulcatus]